LPTPDLAVYGGVILLPRGNRSNSHIAHGYKKELQKSVTANSPQFFHFQFWSCSFIFCST